MRWVLAVLVALIVLVAVVFVGGLMLPVDHVASVRAHVPAPPESVFAVIRDVERAAAWRSDVDSVRIVSAGAESLRWDEWGSFGRIRFVREEEQAPVRLVTRIDGTEQGFGGRWTWRLEAANGGSLVSVTEDGEVYNPAFRFLSRFVFGHYATMENQLRDLGRRFGAEIVAERVEG